MRHTSRRLWAVTATVVLTAIPLAVGTGLLQLASPAIRASTTTAAQVDDLLTAGSALICAAVLGGLSLAVALSSASSLARGAWRGSLRRWEVRASPVAVQRLVAAVIGLALGAGAGSAHAAGRSTDPAWAAVSTPTAGSPLAGPPTPAARPVQVGGHTLTPTVPTASAAPVHGRARAIPSLPGWTPTRTPAAATASSARAHDPGPPPSGDTGHGEDDTVVVLRGDSLWSLAAAHLATTAGTGTAGPGSPSAAAVAREVARWWATNRSVIGTDPDVLSPGQRLHVPPGP